MRKPYENENILINIANYYVSKQITMLVQQFAMLVQQIAIPVQQYTITVYQFAIQVQQFAIIIYLIFYLAQFICILF